ncbi:MAG: hypothetical protein IJK83_11550 [Clostridiales bacterium]|nr:hypothetical protein [Clostridiales bacterium]
MMNYEEFREELMELVSEEINERGLEDLSLKFTTIDSPDGMTDRLMVSVGDSKMSMAFRLEEIYRNVCDGEDINAAVRKIGNTIEESISVIKSKEETVKSFVTDYDRVREHTYLRLIPGNSPILKDAPHKDVGDMAVVVAIHLESMSDDAGKSVVCVSKPLMEMYGIDEAQLFTDAELACTKNDPMRFVPLGDMIRHLIDSNELPDPAEVGITTYIASNESGFQGAGVIAYPGFFDKAAAELGGSFWMLPSSVHEFILIKDDGAANAKDLNAMVRNVNETVLEPRDFLSDQCYHYDAVEKSFTTGLDYEKGVKKSIEEYGFKTEAPEVDNEIDDDPDI